MTFSFRPSESDEGGMQTPKGKLAVSLWAREEVAEREGRGCLGTSVDGAEPEGPGGEGGLPCALDSWSQLGGSEHSAKQREGSVDG